MVDGASAPCFNIGAVNNLIMEMKMNALTKAAKHSIRKQTIENYAIAVMCGIILGVMFGFSI